MTLEATPPVTPPATDVDCDQQNMITPEQTVVDGCPILPKMQCHEVQSGQDARLLWNMKNPQGEEVNLSDCLGSCSSESSQSGDESYDAISTPSCGLELRLRELTGFDPATDKVHCVDVDVLDTGTGYVRARSLPDAITRKPGVYLEEWAVFSKDKRMIFSNQCVVFVRRGLFGLNSDVSTQNLGPPTIEEIRLSLRDNSPSDNLLLDSIEFDAAEISQAVLRPLQFWRETPPPLRLNFTTSTFPYREMWLKGIQGYLMEIAANNYRRNHLPYNAGGVAIDDKNKSGAYDAYASALLQDFRNMVQAKKVEINIASFSGSIGSDYGGFY